LARSAHSSLEHSACSRAGSSVSMYSSVAGRPAPTDPGALSARPQDDGRSGPRHAEPGGGVEHLSAR
jgi:hypothetical protein